MMKKILYLLGLFYSFQTAGLAAISGEDLVKTDEGSVQLVVERPFSASSTTARIGFFFDLKPHWHVYWRNPGDSGLAPVPEWLEGSENLEFSDFVWPVPKRIPLTVLANYGYEGEVFLPLTVTKKDPSGQAPGKLSVKLSWLVCKEECIPHDGVFQVDLRKKTNLRADLNQTYPKQLSSWRWKKIQMSGDELRLSLQVPFEKSKLDENTLDFFPYQPGLIKALKRPFVSITSADSETSVVHFILQARALDSSKELQNMEGLLFLREKDAYEVSTTQPSTIEVVQEDPAVQTQYSFFMLLLLAFVGGMILNLMPCVFPILAIKIFDFSHRKTDSQKELKMQSYFYVLGVLLSFWALAAFIFLLRSQGSLLGWGFQLQSPTFIVLLCALFMLLALNFWGLLQIHIPYVSKAASMKVQEGRLGAVMSGILTTIVSTPCTAPFLGAALGAALAFPMLKSLGIFSCMALGVALPYFALVHTTWLRRKLPKPGVWMESLKNFLGFFMMATVIWLLSVLGKQNELASVIWALTGLLFLSLGIWWKSFWKPAVKLLFFALALVALSLARTNTQEKLTWEKFDPAKAKVLAADRMVFIDFTASWCLTCQVNKAVAIETDAVKKAFEKYGVVAMRADWTNQDQMITKELAKYGRSSVPTNVILGPGNEKPLVLPTLLTASSVIDAIEKRKKP